MGLLFKTSQAAEVNLVVGEDRLGLAAVEHANSMFELKALAQVKRETSVSLAEQIHALLSDHKLTRANCSLTLKQSQYQLLLVDVPDIPDEEIDATLKFKAGDLLQYPVSEASLSVFRLPEEAYRGRLKMAYIVASKRNFLEELYNDLGYRGILLSHVDIADMAYRNLGLLATQKQSFAILRIGREKSYINCCYQGYMCLNRQVDVGANQLQSAAPSPEGGLSVDNLQIHLDSMALEIQRSLDYFESQLGLGSIPEILVIAPDEVNEDILNRIDQAFQTRVYRMKPEEHLRVSCDYSHNLFNSNSIALGGALRNIGVNGL